jgi:hypothetical protein
MTACLRVHPAAVAFGSSAVGSRRHLTGVVEVRFGAMGCRANIARLAWNYTPTEDNNKAFSRVQSFVAGTPTNLQFMVKDSTKYAATGGWGFAQFDGGKAAGETLLKTCFPCHAPARAQDFVFTYFAP